MGKRRKPTPVGEKASWHRGDELALLGLLDFSIKHERVFPFNEGNVVGRLCSVGGSREYTWDQMNRKLKNMWRSWGGNDAVNKEVLYLEGSTCLVGLTEDDKRVVELNVERLENLLKPTSLMEQVLNAPIARKTPSASPYTTSGGLSQTPECHRGSGGRLTPRAQRHQTRELVKQSKWKWESPEQSLSENEVPRKRLQRTKEDPQHRYEQEARQDSGDFGRESGPLLKEQLVPKDNQLKPIENEEDTTLSAVPTSRNHNFHGFTPLRLGSVTQQLQRDPVSSPATLKRIHRAALQKREEKIMELQETLNANEEKFATFQIQLDSFGSVQEWRQEGEDSVELHISNLNQEIRHLKRAKDDYRKIGKFTKLAGSFDASRKEMNMEVQVPAIRRLMKNVLGGCDDDTTLKVPWPNVSTGLRALLSFGWRFDLDDQTTLGKEKFKLLLSSRPPYSIVETLIGAAVCTWVFESDFPNFEQEPGDLSLFAKYRELIAIQDGAVALRNLELATHHSLIQAPRFHTLMNNEAEDLAAFLSETLAPFFVRNAEESEKNAFETWGEEESVWKARRQRLVAIFKNALKMKASSLLTPEQYELVYYASGTVFDPATMAVETIDGAPVDTPTGEGHQVEHCLHVAIHAFTREAVKDTDPVSKAIIQSKNFTRGGATESSRCTDTAPIVLSKAVVVLRKEVDEDAHSDGTIESIQVAAT